MCTVHCAFLSLLYTFLFGSPWCYTKSLSTFLWVSSPKTIFTPDWSCLMLVHKAYVGYRKFPAEKQKEKERKEKRLGRGLNSHSHIPHSYKPINSPLSRHPPTHTTHPSILSPPHTHTHTHTHTHPHILHPYTSIHPHTQPQDPIHMHVHRLLVPYSQAVRVIGFEFMSTQLFALFSGLCWQAFDFLCGRAS